jgi:hypothetical protein
MPLDCENVLWKLDSESDPDHIADEGEEDLMSDLSVAPGEVDRDEGAEEG